jgi:ketosteroid isomerase-like protein
MAAAPAVAQTAPDAEAGRVLSVDQARFQAWQAGDMAKMGALVADDVAGFDGTVPMGVLPNKKALLDAAAAALITASASTKR